MDNVVQVVNMQPVAPMAAKDGEQVKTGTTRKRRVKKWYVWTTGMYKQVPVKWNEEEDGLDEKGSMVSTDYIWYLNDRKQKCYYERTIVAMNIASLHRKMIRQVKKCYPEVGNAVKGVVVRAYRCGVPCIMYELVDENRNRLAWYHAVEKDENGRDKDNSIWFR